MKVIIYNRTLEYATIVGEAELKGYNGDDDAELMCDIDLMDISNEVGILGRGTEAPKDPNALRIFVTPSLEGNLGAFLKDYIKGLKKPRGLLKRMKGGYAALTPKDREYLRDTISEYLAMAVDEGDQDIDSLIFYGDLARLYRDLED